MKAPQTIAELKLLAGLPLDFLRRLLPGGGSYAGHEQLALEGEFFGHGVVEVDEEFVLEGDLAFPIGGDDGLDFVELVAGELREAFAIEFFGEGHPAENGFAGADAAMATVDDPFEDAHVFAEAGPEIFSGGVFAE